MNRQELHPADFFSIEHIQTKYKTPLPGHTHIRIKKASFGFLYASKKDCCYWYP